ncbi:hypothetical protein ASPZODRAFT_20235 [Penicilliopsis zonata CBS 506.65]|uniref:Uncharacterized protein n=1 Tax=Penicilliopsis zonata CBS 506.65 TaxID=1073090 RepID=A0A1L9S6A8_9EURO|nr:hypothetical protein ASPZODRAFT_20235 [Penicilliopsis zonata CBS 506.65]OJJ42709.1 hypothetical protein ASPZODRAFT_20235 [Penicilliopsis zonata CBS 506.65]
MQTQQTRTALQPPSANQKPQRLTARPCGNRWGSQHAALGKANARLGTWKPPDACDPSHGAPNSQQGLPVGTREQAPTDSLPWPSFPAYQTTLRSESTTASPQGPLPPSPPLPDGHNYSIIRRPHPR